MARQRATIAIGGIRVALETADAGFLRLLEERYAGFLAPSEAAGCEFEVEIAPPVEGAADDDVRVYRERTLWRIERGDFRAEWNPASRRGRIRQSANPYSIDTLLRIVHTLELAPQGGFLLHAASAVRNGRAFVFAGVSGAGKTTISRLAPRDTKVLTDEISYIRKESNGYYAYGTPFAGELARAGENLRAPLTTVYLLAQGQENRIDAAGKADALRAILRNILFFAEDAELVRTIFDAAANLVECVPVRRLTFLPDARVWELVG